MTPPFEPSPAAYLYEELANYLAQLIEAGELKPNEPLPNERHLAHQYGVSLGTARHGTPCHPPSALPRLGSHGPAKGSYIASITRKAD